MCACTGPACCSMVLHRRRKAVRAHSVAPSVILSRQRSGGFLTRSAVSSPCGRVLEKDSSFFQLSLLPVRIYAAEGGSRRNGRDASYFVLSGGRNPVCRSWQRRPQLCRANPQFCRRRHHRTVVSQFCPLRAGQLQLESPHL